MRPPKTQHQIIRNPSGQIKFRKFREGGYEHYHLGVWIAESDAYLDRIERVEYELHSSFRQRVRSSTSRSNKFSITFWTWGEFDIQVRVHLRDGSVVEGVHKLEYELPEDSGENYVDVG